MSSGRKCCADESDARTLLACRHYFGDESDVSTCCLVKGRAMISYRPLCGARQPFGRQPSSAYLRSTCHLRTRTHSSEQLASALTPARQINAMSQWPNRAVLLPDHGFDLNLSSLQINMRKILCHVSNPFIVAFMGDLTSPVCNQCLPFGSNGCD